MAGASGLVVRELLEDVDWIRRLASRLLRDEHLADDVVQNRDQKED